MQLAGDKSLPSRLSDHVISAIPGLFTGKYLTAEDSSYVPTGGIHRITVSNRKLVSWITSELTKKQLVVTGAILKLKGIHAISIRWESAIQRPEKAKTMWSDSLRNDSDLHFKQEKNFLNTPPILDLYMEIILFFFYFSYFSFILLPNYEIFFLYEIKLNQEDNKLCEN